jgi:hypothetical protein
MTLTEKNINHFINQVISESPVAQKPFIEMVRNELKQNHLNQELSVKLLLGLDSVESLTVFHCLNTFQNYKNEKTRHQGVPL